MAGKRTAAIAFGLVIDLAERLAAAGTDPERLPDLDEALCLIWPLAKRLAKFERHGKGSGMPAARAREAFLTSAVAGCRGVPWWTWPEFRPGDWHLELVPGPSPDREREAA
jgi:hypothetical protein